MYVCFANSCFWVPFLNVFISVKTHYRYEWPITVTPAKAQIHFAPNVLSLNMKDLTAVCKINYNWIENDDMAINKS